MGYYIRILTPSRTVPPLAAIRQALDGVAAPYRLECDDDPADWRWMEVTLPSDVALCVVERSGLGDDDGLAREEIDEFLEEIAGAEPASAVAWLTAYLPTVQTIYCLQISGGTEKPGGWDLVTAAKDAIWGVTGGVIQADNEGFSNEDGYHILWQFNETVTGGWWMAVLEDGRWVRFEMDLGDQAHRAAFKQGGVPPGVKAQAS